MAVIVAVAMISVCSPASGSATTAGNIIYRNGRRLDEDQLETINSVLGVRRTEESDEDLQNTFLDVLSGTIDAGLCLATTNHVVEENTEEFVATLTTAGSKRGSFSEIADDLAEWCMSMEEESRRRRRETGLEDNEARMSVWAEYQDNVLERLSLIDEGMASAFRRTSTQPLGWGVDADDVDLPEGAFSQCAGYATAMSVILSEGGGVEDAAAIFGTYANGDASEKRHGCGSVVNTVNDVVRDGKSDALEIAEDQHGNEIVIVTDDSLIAKLGRYLNVVLLAGASTSAMKLLDVCTGFETCEFDRSPC